MDGIRIGLRGSKEIVVTEKDLASVTGNIALKCFPPIMSFSLWNWLRGPL